MLLLLRFTGLGCHITLTPVVVGSVTLTAIVSATAIYPSSTTYPSSSLYPQSTVTLESVTVGSLTLSPVVPC